ncbi:MAG: glycine cleavage system protein GcvH [Endomicrobiales bacterium]|nr:glycine cleavage system protein GcvH [Endomicrobiales bacterium]
MSLTPNELKYTKTHEWARVSKNKITVGITDHAQHEITDIVHVELPAIGKMVEKGAPCVVVESVKSAFDIYAPVSGKITAINNNLNASPELINQDPYGAGYLIEIEVTNQQQLDELLDVNGYLESIK